MDNGKIYLILGICLIFLTLTLCEIFNLSGFVESNPLYATLFIPACSGSLCVVMGIVKIIEKMEKEQKKK